ncbi:SCO7613 C-terminal domain-containing membrane protein [Microbacterium hibisci]|uniref:SCO7613 C-terminal domain-containing membrane protein n=1 Tax=Microbacterium hibisci TaxID=2036000 RepID=UPI0019455723|nr:hypothetical protein [Microbacterium hibisci]
MTASPDRARLWPVSPFDLADASRCPSCFTLVSAPVCPTCAFVLTDARAPRVLELGREIVTAELERQQLMDEILASARVPVAASAARAAAVTDAAILAPATMSVDVPVAVTPEPAVLEPAALTAPDVEESLTSSVMDQPVSETPVAEVPVPDLPVSAPVPAGPQAVPMPAPPVPPVTTSAAGPGTARPATPPPAAVAASAPRRRLTVPVLLLIVGVSLVGVAAVFFLVLAWFAWGIEVRALIIGGITLATIGLASWLRRRSLTATAEGIGALGVVLLALDAWAVRANDLFGAGSVDAAVYTGASALVVAVLFRLWARVSHLRGPDLAASLAFPAGIGFLVAGLVDAPAGEAVTAGLLGAAAGGLAHALPAPWSSARRGAEGVPERLVLAVAGVVALVGAALTALFLTGDAVPIVVWSSAGLVALGIAHAWLAGRPVGGAVLPASTAIAGVASGLATAAAALVGWQLAARTELPVYSLLIAPGLAALVAYGLDVVRSRRDSRALLPAAIVSAAVAAVSTVGVTIWWGAQAAQAIESGWTPWRTEALAQPALAPEDPWLALGAAVFIAALLLRAPTLTRPGLRELAPVAATVVMLAAGARTAVPAALVGLAGVIAVAAIVITAVAVRRSSPAVPSPNLVPASPDGPAAPAGPATPAGTAARAGVHHAPVGWIVAGAMAAATAYVAGVATPWLWAVAVVIAIAYPIALRIVVRPTGTAAVATAIAPVAIAALSTVFAPAALSVAIGLAGAETWVALALLQWVALATLAAAVALRIERGSRTALALAAELLVIVGVVAVAGLAASGAVETSPLLSAIGEPALGIVRGALLLVAFAIVAMGRTRIDGVPAVVAAALAAPVAAATVFDALRTFDARGEEWAPLLLTAATVVVPVVAAVTALLRRSPTTADPASNAPTGGDAAGAPPRTTLDSRAARRLAADAGAGVTVLTVVWGVSGQLAWAILALIGLGLAAASVSRGWAAPAGDPADDRFAITRDGMPLADAPRRLLAWPAVAAAIAAWWSWLTEGTPATSYTIESYVLPVAVALVIFAALLVWLRRRAEATVALAVGLALALWIPAVAGWTGDALRGVVVALAAVVVTLALAFTPVRGIRPVAPAGAAVAMTGLGLVAVERALDGPGWHVLWVVLLVAIAYASGAGMARVPPGRASSRAYGHIVPPAALVAALPVIVTVAAEPRIVAGTVIMLAALHLAAAGLDRVPLTAATRWIALASAAVVGTAGWLQGAVVEIEAVSLPVAAMCLVGAVLGMLRRRSSGASWPAAEGPAWITGLVLATAPSLIVAAEPARVWAYVVLTLLAAAGVAAVREPADRAVDTPATIPAPAVVPPPARVPAPAVAGASAPVSAPATAPAAATAAAGAAARAPWSPAPTPAARPPRFPDVWSLRTPTVAILGAAALAMGVRGLLPPGVAGDTAAAIVAAVGVLAVAVLFTATAATDRPGRAAAVLAGAGAALLVLVTITRPDADLVTTTVTAVIGGAVGVAGASVLGLRRWAPLGAVLAVGGLVSAVAACAMRFFAVAPLAGAGLEADLWAVAAAGIAAAIALAALRATDTPVVARAAGAGFAAASVLFAMAELQLLFTQTAGDELRAVIVMSALTVAAAVGFAARARLGLSPAIAAAVASVVFGLVALTAAGVRPVELVTVPPAIGGILLGARTLRRHAEARTWPTLGPWLALLTVPSLLHDFSGSGSWLGGTATSDDTALWRIVGLGLVAIAMVVIGAVYRLQAPLVLGSAVLLLHAVAQLWPWISNAYVAVPWWLWLGLGGALLIFIAARYEKRMRALRSAFVAVTSLR